MINVIFQSKEPVTASTIFSTRQFTEIIRAKFKSPLILNEKTIVVNGIWLYTDANGVEHKINDIKFEFPSVQMKQIEFQNGKINTNDIYHYASERIKQIFPLILDMEKQQDPNANFGLGSADVELIN